MAAKFVFDATDPKHLEALDLAIARYKEISEKWGPNMGIMLDELRVTKPHMAWKQCATTQDKALRELGLREPRKNVRH